MPWKSPSSSVLPNSKAMARSKPGAKSIRGQISAPIPVADLVDTAFAPSRQPVLSREQTQFEPRTAPLQVHDQTHSQGRAYHTEPANRNSVADPPAPPTQPAVQNIAAKEPEGGKRLSKTQPKPPSVRKKSPIRHALGRLFGKKRKTPSQLATKSEPSQRSSAPPARTASQNAPNLGSYQMLTFHQEKTENDDIPRSSGAGRSASMPVTEYDRALRSHSIGPDDVLAIQSARNSVAVEQTHIKKRSGGSTSPYPLGARYVGDGKLAGLCPRPASANDKDLHTVMHPGDDPSEIGRAITSDFGGANGVGLKRRSRSMSAMSFFEASQEEPRRRSQEVKNLRESCYYGEDIFSPVSSEFPEDDPIANFDLDLPDPPRPPGPEPTTPEGFMFGNLISEEEATNRQQVEEVSLNARVNGMENRLHVLEDSVSLLRYKSNPYNAAPGWKPSDGSLPMGLGIQPSFSYPNTTNPHHSLSMGMGQSSSTRPSSGHSDAIFTEAASNNSGTYANNYTTAQPPSLRDSNPRPMSEHTLRGPNPPPTSLQQKHTSALGEEQYTAILGLLETERSARVALQLQVQQLTRQLNFLLGKHSKPSHAPPPAPGPVSAFDYDADESESTGSQARYSGWHHPREGYSLEDSGIDPGTSRASTDGGGGGDRHHDDDDDDNASSGAYVTPSEEQHGFAYAAPRAMSLSRMTMGQIQTPVM